MAKESTGWKKQAKQEMQERAMGRYYKVTPGAHTLRILPNKKGVDYPPFLIVRVHRNVGPNKAFIRCGKKAKSGEGSCWLCDKKIPQLEASSKKSLLQKAKEMVANEQAVFQVAWIDDNEKWHGPKVLILGIAKQTLANRLITFIANPKVDYTDPVKGRNIYVERTGTGLKDTRYSDLAAEDEATKVPSGILAKLENFLDIVGRYDEENMKAVYEGQEAEEKEPEPDEDESEEESESDDEEESDDDDEEEDESGDDDEEEKPAVKKKGTKKKDEDEEEDEEETEDEDVDEEETEDEEDEDEPVVKKKTAKKKGSKKEVDEEDEESGSDDEEEDEEETEDEDDGESEDEEETEDDEEEKPAVKKKGTKKKDEDEEEDEEETEDEDVDEEDLVESASQKGKKGRKKAPPAKGKKSKK